MTPDEMLDGAAASLRLALAPELGPRGVEAPFQVRVALRGHREHAPHDLAHRPAPGLHPALAGDDHQRLTHAAQQLQEGKGEHVERHVAPEQRIGLAKRHRLAPRRPGRRRERGDRARGLRLERAGDGAPASSA